MSNRLVALKTSTKRYQVKGSVNARTKVEEHQRQTSRRLTNDAKHHDPRPHEEEDGGHVRRSAIAFYKVARIRIWKQNSSGHISQMQTKRRPLILLHSAWDTETRASTWSNAHKPNQYSQKHADSYMADILPTKNEVMCVKRQYDNRCPSFRHNQADEHMTFSTAPIMNVIGWKMEKGEKWDRWQLINLEHKSERTVLDTVVASTQVQRNKNALCVLYLKIKTIWRCPRTCILGQCGSVNRAKLQLRITHVRESERCKLAPYSHGDTLSRRMNQMYQLWMTTLTR